MMRRDNSRIISKIDRSRLKIEEGWIMTNVNILNNILEIVFSSEDD